MRVKKFNIYQIKENISDECIETICEFGNRDISIRGSRNSLWNVARWIFDVSKNSKSNKAIECHAIADVTADLTLFILLLKYLSVPRVAFDFRKVPVSRQIVQRDTLPFRCRRAHTRRRQIFVESAGRCAKWRRLDNDEGGFRRKRTDVPQRGPKGR